jgi:hypothetical protein
VLVVEQAHDLGQRSRAVVDIEAQLGSVGAELTHVRLRSEAVRRALDALVIAHAQQDRVAGDLSFELTRRPVGDDLTVVDDHQPVTQLVGLLEIVRRQEDRRPAVSQRGDVAPEIGPRSANGARSSKSISSCARRLTVAAPSRYRRPFSTRFSRPVARSSAPPSWLT